MNSFDAEFFSSVLGRVGSITGIDGFRVEVGDLGNNFMGMFVS